jgi:glycosyltransferase involved in cell wall biosynthesis
VSPERPLKVLWFSTTPSHGGAVVGRTIAGGGWIRALEESLRDRVELTVAFYHDEEHPPFEQHGTTFVPMLRRGRRAVEKAIGRVIRPLESDADVAGLLKVVDGVDPDLIHVHGTEGPYGLIQRHTDRPVLLSIQAVLSAYDLKYFSGIDRRAAARSAAPAERLLHNTYADQHRRFAKQARREREILSLSRQLTGRTDWDRRVASVLAPQATYHHLDEILRAPFYDRVWQASPGTTVRLFTTTGPNLYKGFETLVRCAHLLGDVGLAYTWDVAGLGSADPIVGVFLRALGGGLPSRVRLLGMLDDAELADRLVDSDLYVAVSHAENSPNSLCEAQLLGLPSVATFAGGTSSLVTDDEDGVLVQDGDPYAMAGAILELAGDHERVVRLGRRARERAVVRHDPVAITDAVLDLYSRLVQDH